MNADREGKTNANSENRHEPKGATEKFAIIRAIRVKSLPSSVSIRGLNCIVRLNQFPRVRKKRGRAAGVPEQNRFAALESALANQIHQCPERAARIHRIKHNTLAARHQANRLA